MTNPLIHQAAEEAQALSKHKRFFDNVRTFAQPVVPSKKGAALVIVDMQYNCAARDRGANLAFEVIDPGSTAYFTERIDSLVIPTVRKLLDYFRANSMHVIFLRIGSRFQDLRDMPARLRESIRQLERQSGVADIMWSQNPAFQIRSEVSSLPGELVIDKTTYGAFTSTDIDSVLKALNIDVLVFTGVNTNCCVETTARDAADRGFGCVIVDEGTADYDQEAHDAALSAFYFNYGPIAKSADDVIRAFEMRVAVSPGESVNR